MAATATPLAWLGVGAATAPAAIAVAALRARSVFLMTSSSVGFVSMAAWRRNALMKINPCYAGCNVKIAELFHKN
jgi:hypothetical protein